MVGGPKSVGEYIKRAYSPGPSAFDAKFMAEVYEQTFRVEVTDAHSVPESSSRPWRWAVTWTDAGWLRPRCKRP